MLITEWNWDDAKEVWQREAKEEGREEKSEEIARNLKNMNLPIEQIVQGTGLSLDVVAKL